MSELIHIPVMPPIMLPKERKLPITQKENLFLAFEHKKPKWMPVICESTQWHFPPCYQDCPGGPTGEIKSDYDWFGTFHQYEEAQAGCTPVPGMFDEIGEWREKVKWPDLDAVDWTDGLQGFVRNPDLAYASRLGSGLFERLHAFEGFEQALVDILTEPEECHAFFERMGKYRIDCINKLQKVYNFDYIINHDDWSNARAPFFSLKTFEETLLDSAIAISEAIHATGAYYMLHCCGKMDAFVPHIVNEIHADALEIQNINDIRGILDNFGAKITPMYGLDPYIMYDPKTTAEQARAYARQVVDQFGAHTCDGAGAVISMHGCYDESYYAFLDELYNYSGDKYAGIK